MYHYSLINCARVSLYDMSTVLLNHNYPLNAPYVLIDEKSAY